MGLKSATILIIGWKIQLVSPYIVSQVIIIIIDHFRCVYTDEQRAKTVWNSFLDMPLYCLLQFLWSFHHQVHERYH